MFSVQSWIWYNLKSYLMLYGACLLDNLLCVTDDSTENPADRYQDFYREFSKHFGLLDYSMVRFEDYQYPYIGVYFTPRSSEKCERLITVGFQVEYHKPTPNCGMQCSKCFFATPESSLCWKDSVISSITDMFYSNFAFELFCREDIPLPDGTIGSWPYNLRYTLLGQPDITGIRTDQDGIITFNIEFDISIDGAYGAGICSGNSDDCMPSCR